MKKIRIELVCFDQIPAFTAKSFLVMRGQFMVKPEDVVGRNDIGIGNNATEFIREMFGERSILFFRPDFGDKIMWDEIKKVDEMGNCFR